MKPYRLIWALILYFVPVAGHGMARQTVPLFLTVGCDRFQWVQINKNCKLQLI